MNVVKFRYAEEKDREIISNLIYETEDYPDFEWGIGSEHDHKKRLCNLISNKENRFYYNNIIIGEENNNIVGVLLLVEGKRIKYQTLLSDWYLVSMQNLKRLKFRMLIQILVYALFYKECSRDELYLSNIIFQPEYRGKGYADPFFNKVYEIAKNKGYDKVSLEANNEELVFYYETKGFKLKNNKSRKMYILLS